MNKTENLPDIIDLLITGGSVISMDPSRPRVMLADIAVAGDRIAAIGEPGAFQRVSAKNIIDASGKICLPGFIDTHTHLFQTMLKGLGRDKPLLEWLDASVRRALKFFTPDSITAAAEVGLLDALKTGTTTVVDYQYCHPERGFDEIVAEVYRRLGIRGVLARSFTDTSGFPKNMRPDWIETERDFLDDTEALAKRYAGGGMMDAAVAPGIIWDLSREGFQGVHELSERFKMMVSMHVVETPDDDAYAMKTYGLSTLNFLDSLGLLNHRFHGVHGVHVTQDDLELLKRRGAAIGHCPISNMLLASGNAPVREMLRLGIPVGLCCDGAASNDAQDMFEVMKITALVHKLVSGDASAVSAYDVLHMATLGGAQSIGKDAVIGSLTPGKFADVVILNPLDVKCAPVYDPIHMAVYSGGRTMVDTVIVNGSVLLNKGVLRNIDEKAVIQNAQQEGNALLRRADMVL